MTVSNKDRFTVTILKFKEGMLRTWRKERQAWKDLSHIPCIGRREKEPLWEDAHTTGGIEATVSSGSWETPGLPACSHQLTPTRALTGLGGPWRSLPPEDEVWAQTMSIAGPSCGEVTFFPTLRRPRYLLSACCRLKEIMCKLDYEKTHFSLRIRNTQGMLFILSY